MTNKTIIIERIYSALLKQLVRLTILGRGASTQSNEFPRRLFNLLGVFRA